ncbi:3-keto-5-aminohexanoate cleavage protein [Pelosinus sp. sgz500959]|uniref:3-keto-5-aminohexanoate cleavage protein n=1 Tax=Pelosinus sp. sgz500959 TaxID=3242472 RepID=UPI00367176D2
MAKQSKIIITAAITGATHTPSLSPYFPSTPEQIIKDAVEAHKAGAAVVHIHARDPKDCSPTPDINIMRKIVTSIKEQCNAVVCITTGGAVWMSSEQRLAPAVELKPELASCNAGSVNFVFADLAAKIKNPKFDWEIPYLQHTNELVFTNTFTGLEYYLKTMNEHGMRPEFEVYDVGMVNNIAYFKEKGLVKGPVYLQFVMGILGGIPATVDNLAYLVKTAREQIGDFVWSCAAAGKAQFPMVTTALAMGGNARVGLEDNLYLKPGVLAKSSAEQVIQIKEIAERLGLEIANADEAREILDLKGIEQVNY